ncbi:hypothetical protein GCM10022242_13480 [Nocardioides panacisoli]|uniref:DUF2631 domain-containing protein n=1 Tax=Nocardioides panacisoli TaxID=627624 RepID=A0ABP7I8K4_9ACTN
MVPDNRGLRAIRAGTEIGARHTPAAHDEWRRTLVIILGVILLVLGAIFNVPILWTLGIIAVIIGAVLWIAGSMGHSVGPRAHYW